MNKITRYITLALMAFLFAGNAWSQGFIVGPAAKRFLSSYPVEVGYPTASSPSRQKIQEIADNPNNYTLDDLDAASEEFFKETDIVMPEDGKTYQIVYQSPNGTQFYAEEKLVDGVATDIALTPKADIGNPNEVASLKFTCKRTADGKYNFVTAAGNYYCIHASYYGNNFFDVSTTGFTTEYKAEDNDLELFKLLPGDKVEGTADKLVGFMCIKGKRGINKNTGAVSIGYHVSKSNGSDYSFSEVPYFSDVNTSAVRLIEVEASKPLVTFPVASVSPEGGFDNSFESFPEVTLTFDRAITPTAKQIIVAMRGADTQATAYVTTDETDPTKAIVHVIGAEVSGLYTLTLPQGLFTDSKGAESEEKVLSYLVEIPIVANTYNYESVNPQNESEVEVLDKIVLTYSSQDQPGNVDANKAMVPIMCGEEFYTTATVELDAENWDCVNIVLGQEITEAGTYTIQIPEGVIWNTLYDGAADDKGVAAGARYNPEFILTYTVSPKTTTFPIASVTPEGGFEQSFKSFPEIALTFDYAVELAQGKEIAVYMRGGETQATAQVAINEAEPTKATITVSGAEVSGLYTLTLPQGLFVTPEGAESEEKVLSYLVEIPVVANTFVYESVTPTNESVVKKLDWLELTYNTLDQPGYINPDLATIPVMCGEEYYANATVMLNPDDWNCVTITLVQDITEPGTYTFIFPEGLIWNLLYDGKAEDKGVSNGARYNPEFTLTYTVNPVGDNVQNIDELSLEKAYLLYNPVDNVYAVYDSSQGNNIWSANPVNGHFSDYATDLNIDSPSSSWMGIKDNEGNFYIYNLGNEKFLQTPGWASNGNTCTAATFSSKPVPVTVVTRADGYLAFTTHPDDDHTFFCAAAAESDRQMSIWTSDDHGCAWVFQENPNVKADSEILDKITAIQQVLNESKQPKAIYDLSGVKMQETDINKLPKGVYIVDGKKVVK